METAHIILINGKIATFDPQNSKFEALAIKEDRIVAVGTNHEISKLKSASTQVIDLKGRFVTPGLIDSHIHLASSGTLRRYALDLSHPNVKSITDIVEIIRERIKESRPGEWIRGVGWDEARLDEKRYVTRWDLDPVSPDNPITIGHTSGHFLSANSLALKLAGITRDTPQPEGGTIVKDEAGEPTGVMKELASKLFDRVLPRWTKEQMEEGIDFLCGELVKEGITTIKDGCTLEGYEVEAISGYHNLAMENRLKVRAYFLWQVGSASDVARIKDYLRYEVREKFKLGGIKIFMDGSMMGRTAWCYEGFLDPITGKVDQENKGYPVIQEVEYEKIVMEACRLGYQVCTHAIGDRAIDAVLKTYETAIRSKKNEAMFTIIHGSLATREQIKKMKELGVCVETQSSFLYFLSPALARSISPALMSRLIPLRSLIKEGVVVGNGSDYYVAPFAPRFGIWAACTRESVAGGEISRLLGTAERIGVHEALQTYTTMAAKCLLLDDKIGSLEKGKLADLAVWEDDLYSIPAEKIKDARVVMTMVGGVVVHDVMKETR